MKKKLFILITVFLFTITLTGCGSGISDITSGDDSNDIVVEVLEVEVGEGSVVFNDPYEDYTLYNYVALESSTETITITIGGYYLLEGTYSNIVIDTVDEDVDLVFNNATISSESGPAVLVLSADVVTFSALEGTENLIEDSSEHPLNEDGDDYNGAIYSYTDLEFNGSGVLTVDGNYNNAIYTKDDIKIQDIIMNVTSVDDGLVGKDYVAISSASVTIDVNGDGIVSTNTGETDKGFVYIESGLIDITAGDDGIQAELAVLIYGGTIDIYARDNGIQSENLITIDGGTISIAAEGDGINAVSELAIYDGDIIINVDEDGLHSDDYLLIDGGDIYIQYSYEGIEAYVIVINGGDIVVNSTDDAINGTAGGGQAHGQEVYISDGGTLFINGGTIYINSVGDGIDVNGSIEMTGGYVVVYGSTTDMQSSIDYDETFNISGGTIIALGSDGMVQTLSNSSTQASLMLADMSSYTSDTTVTLTDEIGNIIIEVESIKYFEAVTISSPAMVEGQSYTLTVGTDQYEFTISDIITTLGSGGTSQTGGFPPRR
jgi:hypothetical protein